MLIPSRTNTAVLFLDLQEQIVQRSRTVPVDKLRRTAGALAKLAALHRVPVFLSDVPSRGAFLDEVLAPLGNPQPRPRTDTSAFADAGLVAALEETGRRVLILAGVASEIVVQRTALAALAAGYEVEVAVDASGGIDARTEEAAWRRVVQAGGATTSVITFAAELVENFATEIGGQTMSIAHEAMG